MQSEAEPGRVGGSKRTSRENKTVDGGVAERAMRRAPVETGQGEVSWLYWRGLGSREQMAALVWRTRNWSLVRAELWRV